ncbi:30S ribosomal protein S24e [Candidatus Pacearchaeota archaeon CG10_big_fil_rev_8_21_14_0_10_31_24]|nr:MAG: 30S ribosomal protein S24e [Candidatus Pacearchaeota archaeon CG10_big_fil_rev_8_21_14_0_10_31_24]
MKITKEFQNKLLKRKEVEFVIEEKGNPGFEKVRKLVSDKFKAGEDTIAIKYIKSKFGSNDFFIEAFIYDSANDKLNIEPKIKEKKVAQ